MSRAPRALPHSRTWLRAFVLLLALLMPGALAELPAAPAAVAAESAEHDVADTVWVRAPARAGHRTAARRTAVRQPSAPLPVPGAVPGRGAPAPRAPHALAALRSVVLLC
ncbi:MULTISPECIES: hypothetical protein [unclassified Streptomyces]|uniref:hypothetical protein n=1 Tax=unclassified Streptomyces TaxID=2593676 RepID=UPI001F044258|nr:MULTISPECIES: hypothetical protein [unclassified Streptomyces]MCH0566984.1 hypothetical protein [Streptomyces sp. MUM 2J]MCH0572582.1 hypothetical protein [Streptomyces sp. MUM 136J]